MRERRKPAAGVATDRRPEQFTLPTLAGSTVCIVIVAIGDGSRTKFRFPDDDFNNGQSQDQ